jgi:hypothetical protein
MSKAAHDQREISQDHALALQLALIAGSEAAQSRLEIRWRNASGRMRQQWHGVRELDRTARAIRNLCRLGDTYVGAAPRVRVGGKGRDVERVHCLWVDLDTAETLAQLTRFEPEPSLVIETGSGGGHAYWQLREPLSGEWAQRANRRLVKALNGDAAATDPARVLRPAGTLNYKHSPPRPVVCVLLEPKAYVAAEIVGGLADDRRYVSVKTTPALAEWSSGPDGLSGLLRMVRESTPNQDRNRRLFWAACRAGEQAAAGRLDVDAAAEALREAGVSTGLAEPEVLATIRSGLRTGGAP